MSGLLNMEDDGRRALIALLIVIVLVAIIIGAGLSFQGNFSSPSVQNPSDVPIKLGDAVHAYTQGGQLSIYQQNLSPKGNTITAKVNGYILDPLNNSDPTSDYYIFNVLLTGSAQDGWHVTSDDLNDIHGPSVQLSVMTSPSECICLDQISPSSLIVNDGGNKPQTIAVSMSVSSVDFGVSYTFTPSVSKTEPTVEATNEVAWASAGTTNGNPSLPCYSYNFALAVRVPKNSPATIDVSARANFYRAAAVVPLFNIPLTYDGDSATLSLTGTFVSPPITTINAFPSQPGMLIVDGNPVNAPAQFVWDEDNPHTISAAPIVSLMPGIRYVFKQWSDGGGMSHAISSPTEPMTITVTYETQYELNVAKCDNGKITPSMNSYWYPESQLVSIAAIPNSGYYLRNWVIDGINQNEKGDITILMNQPHDVNAVFAGYSNDNTSLIIAVIVLSLTTVAIVSSIVYLRKKRGG